MSSLAERLPLDDAPPSRAVRKRTEEALAAGGIVCLPTETVYGLAVRADDTDALAALRALKGRDADVPLTWHVASRDAVERFEHLVPLARRLVERYWPGPLTLVLEGVPDGLALVARDGTTGVRFPAHRGTTGILAKLRFPVVATSANRSGSPPLLDAGAIQAELGAGLALILDGGRSRLGEPSTVLRLGRGRFEVLREGLVTAEELRAAAGLRIGFCCTGNTCRSPMAEGLARLELARRLGLAREAARDDAALARFGFAVRSMGVAAGFGAPASPHAVQVLAGEGYDLSRHESSQATAAAVEAVDVLYCLTPAHREALVGLLPPGRARHVQLLDPDGGAIPDPIGGPESVYRSALEAIRACITQRAAEWA
jgi:tRNA threonylcarbamoyl adenosine modification protein (Sua5/YciO/YrdC/YwlC family)